MFQTYIDPAVRKLFLLMSDFCVKSEDFQETFCKLITTFPSIHFSTVIYMHLVPWNYKAHYGLLLVIWGNNFSLSHAAVLLEVCWRDKKAHFGRNIR